VVTITPPSSSLPTSQTKRLRGQERHRTALFKDENSAEGHRREHRGLNPLRSTRKSPRTALGSRRPQSLDYQVCRSAQLAKRDHHALRRPHPPVDAAIATRAGALLLGLTSPPRHRFHGTLLVATAQIHGPGLTTRRGAIFGSCAVQRAAPRGL
jgi:hypothetical protein